MKQKHFFRLSLLSSLIVFCVNAAFADCTSMQTLEHVDQVFKGHDLHFYTIYLTPTLSDIKDGDANSRGDTYPDFKKTWTGACPGGLTGDDNSCIEFTVYPSTPANFMKDGGDDQLDIMPAIEKYTKGEKNRGMVRILTNADETQYVYTTDHETSFCGPYAIS